MYNASSRLGPGFVPVPPRFLCFPRCLSRFYERDRLPGTAGQSRSRQRSSIATCQFRGPRQIKLRHLTANHAAHIPRVAAAPTQHLPRITAGRCCFRYYRFIEPRSAAESRFIEPCRTLRSSGSRAAVVCSSSRGATSCGFTRVDSSDWCAPVGRCSIRPCLRCTAARKLGTTHLGSSAEFVARTD